MMRAPDGTEINAEDWKTRQHEYVFKALERGVEGVTFPASKQEVLAKAADARVVDEPRIPLGPYLDTLPERRFESKDELARMLNQTWVKAHRSIG